MTIWKQDKLLYGLFLRSLFLLVLVLFGVFGMISNKAFASSQYSIFFSGNTAIGTNFNYSDPGCPNAVYFNNSLVLANTMCNTSSLLNFVNYIQWHGNGSYIVCNGWSGCDYNASGYAFFSISSGNVVPNNPDTSTHFTSFTISTSTQTVNVQGYWNATTTPGVSEQLEFYQYNPILGKESYITQTATTSGSFNFDFPYLTIPTPAGTTTAPITATTTFFANIYKIDSSYYNPFGVQSSLYSTLLVATSSTLTGSTTSYTLDTSRAIALYPEYECSIGSMIGCIKNAGIALFYPSQDILDNYKGFFDKIQTKAPFGYFYIVKEQIDGLSATSTPSFSIVIPAHLKSSIFDPIDTALATILPIFFLFNIYKRIKYITI